MKRLVLFAVLAAAVAVAVGAQADTVILRDKSRVEGKIIEDGPRGVKIMTKFGAIDIPRRLIERVIKESPEQAEYKEKAGELAKEHIELAKWCKENGLEKEAKKHYELAIKFDEDNKTARKALGYVKKGDKWVKAGEEPKKEDEQAKKEEEPEKKETEPEKKPTERLTREEYGRLHADALQKLQNKEYDEAEKLYKRIIGAVPNDRIALYNLACLYSLTEKKEKALEYLKRAIKAGFTDVPHMKQDKDLDNIREEEAFKKLIEELIKSSKENMLAWMGDYDEALKKQKNRRNTFS